MFAFESECFWVVLLLTPILIGVAAMLPIGNHESSKGDYKEKHY